MKKMMLLVLILCTYSTGYSWGFYAHRLINHHAVFLLPPEMIVFYKPNIGFLSEHAVDPDKRRYAVAEEGPKHYIDIDHYGKHPAYSLPLKWKDAVALYTEDTLRAYGIVPWWIQTMLHRLTDAFKKKDRTRILKLSADIGHYISDSHVPLHASSNHNGQLTDQRGIHGFWESRIPELLAETEWDLLIGKAEYIARPLEYAWERVMESAGAADSVLSLEKSLSAKLTLDQKYAFEDRNGIVIKQYSRAYSLAYDKILNNMIERRLRQSIFSVASFWFTAWVNAGQPDLKHLGNAELSDSDLKEFDELNRRWKEGAVKGRVCE